MYLHGTVCTANPSVVYFSTVSNMLHMHCPAQLNNSSRTMTATHPESRTWIDFSFFFFYLFNNEQQNVKRFQKDTGVKLHNALKKLSAYCPWTLWHWDRWRLLRSEDKRHTWSTNVVQRGDATIRRPVSMELCYFKGCFLYSATEYERHCFQPFQKRSSIAFNGFLISCVHTTKCWAKVKMPWLVNLSDLQP